MKSIGICLSLGCSNIVIGQAGIASTGFLEPAIAPTHGWFASRVVNTLDFALGLRSTWQEAGNTSIVTTDDMTIPDNSDVTEVYKDDPQLGIHIESGIVNDGTIPSWIPGSGTCCSGIWDEKWHGKEDLANITMILNQTAPLLLQRIRKNQCPYGIKLPGDVTWRGSIPKELQGIVAPQTTLTFFAVVWSFLPYIVALFTIIRFLLVRGTRQLSVVAWLALIVFVNEGIIKRMFSQPRPGTMLQHRDPAGFYVGSCVPSCGMPSSHSALAIGWFVLLLCDAVQRVHLDKAKEMELISMGEPIETCCLFGLGRGLAWICRWITEKHEEMRLLPTEIDLKRRAQKLLWLIFLTPWVPDTALTLDEFIAFIVFWSLVWLPVPFMRLVLYDHTTPQVLIGCATGALVAWAWWRLVRLLQRNYEHLVNQRTWFFTHNYPRDQYMRKADKEVVNGCWVVAEGADGLQVKVIRNLKLNVKQNLALEADTGEDANMKEVKFEDPERFIVETDHGQAGDPQLAKRYNGKLLSRDKIEMTITYSQSGHQEVEVWYKVFEGGDTVELLKLSVQSWVPTSVICFNKQTGLYDLEGAIDVHPTSIRRPRVAEAPEETVDRLRNELGINTCIVCILGEAMCEKVSASFVKALAEKLKLGLGDAGAQVDTTTQVPTIKFVTAGMEGVQQTFADALADDSLIWNLVPAGRATGYRRGKDIGAGANLEARNKIIGALGHIYITVEGGPGVSQLARSAFERGARVVPVMRTGRASSGCYGFPADALKTPNDIDGELWSRLNKKNRPVEDTAEAVAKIVMGCARQKKELEDVKEVTQRLKRELGRDACIVCVVGETRVDNESTKYLVGRLAEELDRRLGPNAKDRKAKFVLRGIKGERVFTEDRKAKSLESPMNGAQEVFADHFDDSSFVINLLRDGQNSDETRCMLSLNGEMSDQTRWTDKNVGRTDEETDEIFSLVGDIYITVEGKTWVSQVAKKAYERGAVVVPLMPPRRLAGQGMRTDLASARISDKFPRAALQKPDLPFQKQWDLLGNVDESAEHSAEAAAEIVKQYVHEWPREPVVEAAQRVREELLHDAKTIVCILGGTMSESSEALVSNIASKLGTGAAFDKNSVQFVTADIVGGMAPGMNGVQETFAKHCGDGSRVWNLVPVGKSSGYGNGRDIHAGTNSEDAKTIFGLLGDIYVTVEGGPEVSQEVCVAFERGAKVVPLMRTGGASAGKFGFPTEALQEPCFSTREQWSLLKTDSEPEEKSAVAAVAILEKLIRSRLPKHMKDPASKGVSSVSSRQPMTEFKAEFEAEEAVEVYSAKFKSWTSTRVRRFDPKTGRYDLDAARDVCQEHIRRKGAFDPTDSGWTQPGDAYKAKAIEAKKEAETSQTSPAQPPPGRKSTFQVGDVVEGWSNDKSKWIEGVIQKVDIEKGTYDLDRVRGLTWSEVRVLKK
eukprot:CAMPEP_0115207362 /NCGR_PEP_ID=MMETSP0270-20121206/20678_1 /TAXON_ID=71861 /ORGANISM="Scrippsiella trochoidea, Strain CCMP3099" /LENGTH=1437 /DNA_ID=CAMNT_0002620955 /DNA_START=36 /DNA_END=4349 /DNA_ORIENTATION=+